MTKDEALKLALEALETNNKAWKHLADSGDAGFWEAEEQGFYELSVKAITVIKEALAQPETWEKFCDSNCVWTDHHSDCKLSQRTWVGLTEKDFSAINQSCLTKLQAATSAESILKEKNT